MPKQLVAKVRTHAKPARSTGAKWSELLPEMWGEVWKWVLRDKLGNITVPGLVYDARRWRLVCKQFHAVSRATTTPLDATIWFSGVNQPALFKGGLAFGEERRCRLLRHARSGQVFFVTCMNDPDRQGYQQTLKKWSLPDLVACLGGHNADFKTRLRELGPILSGFLPTVHAHRVRNFPEVEGVPVIVDDRGGTVETIYQEAPNTPMHRRGFTSRDYVTSTVVSTETPKRSREGVVTTERVHRRGAGLAFCATFFDSQSTHTVEACEAVPATTDDGGEHVTRHLARAHPQGVHPLVVAFGLYDMPDVAECDGWVVSLLKHGLCKAELVGLVERHGGSSGELVQRVMAASALRKHERAQRAEEKRQRQLAIEAAKKAHRRKSTSLVVYGGAPAHVPARTIATSRPKRKAARAAGPLIAEFARIDQVTLPNGRFTHEQQQVDADSLEDAADGWVDDQYAAEGHAEQDGDGSGSQDEQSEDEDWDPDASDDDEAGPAPPAPLAPFASTAQHPQPLSMDELRAQRMRRFAPHEAMDV